MAMASEATTVTATAQTIYKSTKKGGSDPDGVIAFSIHNYGDEPIRARVTDWGVSQWTRIGAGKSMTVKVHSVDDVKQLDEVIVQRATDAAGDSTIAFAAVEFR